MSRRLAHLVGRGLIRLATLGVPASYRARFREEWRAELWHAAAEAEVDARALLLRACGAFEDAWSTRGLAPSLAPRRKEKGLVFFRDVRLALRSLRKRPSFTLVALATLAVGIGANVAVFSLVDAVLLRPLSYPDSDRLASLAGLDTATGELGNLSPADFYDLAAASETFVSMGAHGWVGFFTITGGEAPERVPGSSVTAGLLETLGVAPEIGRVFTEEDDRPGAAPTTVLTHAFWQRRFGGRVDVLGESLAIDGVPHEVIGVLPASFMHPEPYPDREPALYRLYQFDPSSALRSGRFIRAVGRLAEGRSIEEARSELQSIARRLEQQHPDSNMNEAFEVIDLKRAIVGDARSSLLLLFGAVGAVFLVACANLANLQLAQGARREQTLAIQVALGAGRRRIVFQLATEGLVLALTGATLGVLAAHAFRGSLSLRALPRANELAFGADVLGFGYGLAVVASVLFGLLPALKLSSSGLGRTLVEGGARGASARTGLRRLLIAAEVSLSLSLLVAASLFVKSFSALRDEAPGFRTENVLTFSTSLPLARYPEGTQIPFYGELERRVAALPGVSAVGSVNILPLNNNYSRDGFQIEARPTPEGQNPAAEARSVSPGYFEAMGIPLVRGRVFDDRDRVGSPGVAIVSEAMARRFWPGEDPIGQRITYNRGVAEEGRQSVGGAGSREIVGIVGDVKHLGIEEAAVPMFYTPEGHEPSYHTRSFVVRTGMPAESLVASVRDVLDRLDADVPIYAARSLSDLLDSAVTRPRFRTWLVGIFAGVALGLALVGVYGVVGLVVSQRRHEIGIRMALGAKARDVIQLLVTESMAPVVWGIGAGLLVAWLVSRLLEGFLFRVRPHDPQTFAEVAILLGAAAFAATLVPTLRATRIDPVDTLRE